MVATASQDKRSVGDARLWHAATGLPVGPALPHLNWVAAMTFSPDSQVLVTGGYDRAVHFWNTRTGKRIGSALPVGTIVHRLAFSPDGQALAIGLAGDGPDDNDVVLYDFRSRRPIGAPMKRTGKLFQFSPVGDLLVTASAATLRFWDLSTGRERHAPMAETSDINALEFSHDGRRVLAGGTDGTARIWRADTGQPEGAPMLHPHRVNAVAFSPDPDARMVLVACADGSSQLWDRVTGKRLGPPALQARPILAARFAADGRSFLTSTDQGIARAWPVPTPLTHDLELLTLGLEVRTGRQMGPGQTVLPLSPSDWKKRHERLASLGGPAPSAYAGSVSETAFHEASARDAESREASYAVRWHLDRLIAAVPADAVARSSGEAWLPLARRARACASAGQLDQAAGDDERAHALATAADLLRWYKLTILDCLDRKEWSTASWYLDRALAASPGDGQLRADKSQLERRLGQVAESQADLERAFEGGVDAVDLFRIGDDFVRDERWTAASAAYAHAIERGLASCFDWSKQAVVLLKAGDRRAYQKLCAAVVEGASELPHPHVVNMAAWVCALAPQGLEDYSRLIAALERATNLSPPAARPNLLATMGPLLCRAGRYRDAIARIEESLRSAGQKERFEDWFFLALAHHGLGDANRAQQYFSKLEQARLEGPDRWDRLEHELLMTEARAIFDEPRAPSRTSDVPSH
jgi:hypothetical protein